MLLVCVLAVPPFIYIGWRGGEAAKGAPQVGGILLGRLPIQPPPFPILIRSRKERGGRGNPIPFFLFSFPFPSPIWLAHMGGRTTRLWLVCLPSWPIRPISFAGGARNPFR